MNTTEISLLLGVCAAADNRKPNPEMVQFWLAALGDLDFAPCRDAAVAHYQESTDWIMPAHIRGRVRRDRAARIANDEALELPPHDPDDTALHQRLLREARAEAAAGRTYQPQGLVSRSIRELGGPLRRVNELDDDERARLAERSREMRAEAVRDRQAREAAAKAAEEAKPGPVFTCDLGDPVCGKQATRVTADGRRPACDDHATTKPDPEPLLTDAVSREPEPTTETEPMEESA